ncbi:MAG: phosphate transporter, inner rane subunit PstC [Frankiales bacterium]|jgi:phosphate transport system permease protein|nr:phosphate transporter, inner rane subunit PstC [Frankiales bacterium]
MPDLTAPRADAAAGADTASAAYGGGGAPLLPGSSAGDLPRTASASGQRRGDRVFRSLSLGAGLLLLGVIVAIGVFLVYRALPALRDNTGSFLTDVGWDPNATPPAFGIVALAFGTVLSSVLALAMAFPVAMGVALFISHYAPRRFAGPLGYVVDLLAAVPSVVYGLWGIFFLNDRIKGLSAFLHDHLGFVPLFRADGIYGRSILLASVVLAIMILPIIASLSREVFLQVPAANQEAALALGATRWEMIRMAVLPFGKPGVIGATMLGLGRALGETIAVALVLSPAFLVSFHVLEPGKGNTIAANIALQFGEATATGRGALIASGLVLFAITLVVNVIARAVIYRRRDFAGGSA